MNQRNSSPPSEPHADNRVLVSPSSDTVLYRVPGTVPLTPTDIAHRQAFEEFVINHADEAYRAALRQLYRKRQEYNLAYFEGQLLVPYLMFSTPGSPGSLADYLPISGFGGHSQIRLRPSLLCGNKTILRPGEQFARGRANFIEDVLLHECIHQYHYEVTGKTDRGYKGHGMAFRDTCNEIGVQLGLPPVRAAKVRGKDQELPSCAYWPRCVRPQNYYGGAYLRSSQTKANTAVQADVRILQDWDKFRSSQIAQHEAAVTTLVTAAEVFATTWPGSEQEAVELYLHGARSQRASQSQILALFEAARTLTESCQRPHRSDDDLSYGAPPRAIHRR